MSYRKKTYGLSGVKNQNLSVSQKRLIVYKALECEGFFVYGLAVKPRLQLI